MNITVPGMGESITEAVIGQIFKPSGSLVQEDEEILELETDKVNQVLHAPKAGVVNLTVKQGDKVVIGQVVGAIVESSQKPVETKKEEKKPEPKIEAPKPIPEPSSVSSLDSTRIAKESFFDEKVPVEKLSEKVESSPRPIIQEVKAGQTRKKMSMIRQTIARRLVEAKQMTAMLTTFNEVDMSLVIAIREKYKEAFQKKYDVKLGFLSFFAHAICSALKDHPLINASIDGDEIVENSHVDLGVAISTDRGLVVPVIKHTETLTFPEIEKAIETYAKKAREGGLTVDDMKGGTFTLTNGGTFGSLLSTPILNFPQSGILGMHKIEKRPVVVDDQIVIRPMMYIALTYDHRIVDGKEAVQFLVHVKELLEDPSRFVLDV